MVEVARIDAAKMVAEERERAQEKSSECCFYVVVLSLSFGSEKPGANCVSLGEFPFDDCFVVVDRLDCLGRRLRCKLNLKRPRCTACMNFYQGEDCEEVKQTLQSNHETT